MEDHNLAENQNSPEVYKQNKKNLLLLLAAPFTLFILTLMIELPVGKGIQTFLEDKVLKSRRCPLDYSNLELSYFFPGVTLEELKVSGRCFNKPKQTLEFEKAKFGVSFPSFWPIGIKTKLEAFYKTTQINVFPRFTISGHSIQISNTKITSDFIDQLTPNPGMLSADFDVQGNFELKANKLDSGHLLIKSNNFILPAQSISGIKIPSLPLKNFELAANIAQSKAQIKALRIGNKSSNLEAQFNGSIDLIRSNLLFSKLNLQGKFRVSRDIQEALPLLRLLLNGKKQKEGYYYLNIGGSLAAPAPQIVDPQ